MCSQLDPIRQIEKYLGDCTKLASDLGRLVEDVALRLDGWNLQYAVDYSEIRAYLNPAESAHRLALFSDDSEDICAAIQSAALNTLFFRLDHKPILFRPYEMELAGYLTYLRYKVTEDEVAAAEAVASEAEAILELEDGRHILDLLDQVADGADLPETSMVELVRFAEVNAASCLALLDGARLHPLKAASAFLARRPFIPLSDRIPKDFAQGSKATRERWRAMLEGLPHRGGPANQRDAYVMAQLEAVNASLARERTRIALVTRSTHMHRLMDDDIANGRWFGDEWNPLRHPRVFLAMHREGDRNLSALKDELDGLQSAIQDFIDSAGDFLSQARKRDTHADLELATSHSGESATEQFLTIKDRWHGLANLVAIDSAQPTGLEGTRPGHLQSGALTQLRTLLTDPEVRRDYLWRRIRQLTTEIRRSYEISATLLDDQPTLTKIVREDDQRRARTGAQPSMTTTIDSVPYALRFRSEEMRSWWEKVQRTQRVNLTETLVLASARSVHWDEAPERLLAPSYYYASWDQWEAAERWSRLALTIVDDDSAIVIECLLMLALSLRMKGVRNDDDCPTALRSIRRARRLSDDARLIVEEAAQIFSWHDRLGLQRELGIDPELAVQMTDEALAMLEGAEDSASRLLLIRAYNNRCFFRINQIVLGRGEDAVCATEDLAELRRLLNATEPDRSKWRASILDTVLWSEFVLLGVGSAEKQAAQAEYLLDEYAKLLKRTGARGARGTIAAHRSDIARIGSKD